MDGVDSAFTAATGACGPVSDFAASAGADAGAGLIAVAAGGVASTADTGVGSAASGLAAAAGSAGATAATGAGAREDATCNAITGAAFVPALTASVLTSTGWIGSVDPMTTRACVSIATGSGCAASDDAAAGLKRAGTLIALATANRGSALAFGSAVACVLAATSGFASAFATTFAAALDSALVTTIGWSLRSGWAATTASRAGRSAASATIVAVRLTDANAIFSLIRSRMRASRLAPLLPPMTTATR